MILTEGIRVSYETNSPSSFRTCQHCGELSPAQSSDCAHCGARSLLSVAEVVEAQKEQRFIRSFLTRTTPVTYSIFVFNLIIYVLIAAAPGHNFFTRLIAPANSLVLIAFGAKTNALITQGDFFRLITPIFIHIGVIHLASNSYALWIVGPQVEKLYGSARFAMIYLWCGIGGSLGSYFNPLSSRASTVAGAGASGAIFGLFGVLAVFGFKYRAELPQSFRRAFGAGVLPVILLNLYIGFTFPFIDNAAHLGGLLTGAGLALLIPYYKPGEERARNRDLVVLLLCVAMVAYSFARAYQQSGKYLPRQVRAAQVSFPGTGCVAGPGSGSAPVRPGIIPVRQLPLPVLSRLNQAGVFSTSEGGAIGQNRASCVTSHLTKLRDSGQSRHIFSGEIS